MLTSSDRLIYHYQTSFIKEIFFSFQEIFNFINSVNDDDDGSAWSNETKSKSERILLFSETIHSFINNMTPHQR